MVATRWGINTKIIRAKASDWTRMASLSEEPLLIENVAHLVIYLSDTRWYCSNQLWLSQIIVSVMNHQDFGEKSTTSQWQRGCKVEKLYFSEFAWFINWLIQSKPFFFFNFLWMFFFRSWTYWERLVLWTGREGSVRGRRGLRHGSRSAQHAQGPLSWKSWSLL